MNEETSFSPRERHVWAGAFFSRFQRYRNLLRRRWWVPVACVLLALAAEGGHIWTLPPEYFSVGQMIVNVRLNIQQSSLYTEMQSYEDFLGTQAALMQGAEVLGHAKDRVTSENPDIPPAPVSVSVSITPKTTIFNIRAISQNPKYAQLFAQACMEEYIDQKKQMEEHTSDLTIAGLTDQMLRLEPEMQKDEDQVASFLSTNNAALLEGANGVGNYLTILYQELGNAQSQYDLLQSMTLDQNLLLGQDRTLVLGGITGNAGMGDQAVNAGPTESPLVAGFTGVSPQTGPESIGMEYLTVKQNIALLKAERDRYAEVLKPKHPQMVALDEEIDQYSRILDIYRAQSVEQIEAEKSSLALQITNLQKQTELWGRQNVEFNRKTAEYDRLKAKSERIDALYDQLLATLENLDVNKDISPETVVISQAASDAQPDTAWIQKDLVIAGVAGLILSLLILMLMDRLDDRMNTFIELQEAFDEEVLGQIPRERSPRKGVLPLLQVDDERHSLVESYRNLRSSLLYMEQTGTRPRTLLVTSSVPGEGKTITTANLAITLAISGTRVLLVDADLRKGNLHNRFNIGSSAGLSEILSQGANWRQTVKETSVPNLHLVPRGATTQRSSEFFMGAVMQQLLQESAKEYDYVLLDTAPVMAADDVTSLAPRADGVIFLVRAEFTSARVAHAALDMLHQRKARVLGLVFNSVRSSAADYHYYKYRDYYKPDKAG
ncbi:MAG TPA: polysaccharide biosynthesis tyrosine autokinase [Candidatus Aquilonibacter sp.]|nr:polysaccharide biosynthesis tyrosine autokinase [Candidatus Aquilonibacter sp.]